MDLINLEDSLINKKFKDWIKFISDEECECINPEILSLEIDENIVDIHRYLKKLCDNSIATQRIKIACANRNCDNELIIDYEYANMKEECQECGTVVTPKNHMDIKGIFYDVDKTFFNNKGYKNELNTSDILGVHKEGVNKVVSISTKINEKDNIQIRKGDKIEMYSKKIFISHATSDEPLVRQLIMLLASIGVSVDKEHLFCSSVKGMGVPVGKDLLNYIKNQFDDDILVLFVMTDTFFNRPACICEMGAAWVKSKDHISLLVPPKTFDDVSGLINTNIKGIMLNDDEGLDELKDSLIERLGIDNKNNALWDISKKTFLENIEDYIKNQNS